MRGSPGVDRWLQGLTKLSGAAIVASGGYDATEHRGRRRPPMTGTSSEDVHLDARRRQILSATSRDLARNWASAQWAIRKHLAFVADFSFQAKTDDPGFNKDYEAWWAEKCKKHQFDVASRHTHRRAVKLAEACKSVDGDVLWMKLAPSVGDPNRGCIQAIEGDRIDMPRGSVPANANWEEWVNGVRVEPDTGRALAYGICRRVGRTQKVLQRIVPARNVFLHANYEFRYDQVRGISPLAAALNQFRDTQEGVEFALAKLKVGQMFGVQITHNGEGMGGPLPAPEEDEEGESCDDDGQPRINLGRAPYVVELEPGEEAKVIESRTPSTETVDFLKLIIHIALRSLDIPYSFFDESFTNFYGSRGGLIQYLHSCTDKVIDLQELQDEHHRWRVGLGIADRELVLPSGKDFSWLKWEFVPGGVPWWDPVKEVRGQAMAIAAGLSSPQRACREVGTVFEENVDQIADAQAYAKSKGVSLTYADSSAFAPAITIGGDSDAN